MRTDPLRRTTLFARACLRTILAILVFGVPVALALMVSSH
jgi:hypothetical protein